MDRKRPTTTSMVLENRVKDPLHAQYLESDPKRLKLASELPYSTDGDFNHKISLDLLMDLSLSNSPSQVHDGRRKRTLVNYNHESKNNVVEPYSDSSSSTSLSRRVANFSDYNAGDDIISIVDLADSPISHSSFNTSDDDADEVPYNRSNYDGSRCDESVVCLENEDRETVNSVYDVEEEHISDHDIKPFNTEFARSLENSASLLNRDQPTWDDSVLSAFKQMTEELSDSQRTLMKSSIQVIERQFSRQIEEVKSERVLLQNLKAEVDDYRKSAEWQDAKIRYLEVKLQERNDFEFKLETANQLNEILEKKLIKYEKAATDLPRLREKIKRLEEDKRCKEELGQTISNLIDDTTSLKTEISSLTSIANMLESENSTLKQKCEAAERATAAALQNCAGDDVTNENCCLRIRELKDKITEMVENEFKCSICEEMFIDASVTNCNHVFCAHCLSEWMKKKRDCPHCRKNITQQCRAPVIDEFVLNICKVLSEKMHSERVQVVNERKAQSSPKGPQQTSSRKTSNGSVRVVPLANLRNSAYSNSAFLRSLHSQILPPSYYSNLNRLGMMEDPYYRSDMYGSSTSSAGAVSSSSSSMAAASASSPAPLALDVRSRSALQSALTAPPSSMHASASSTSTSLPSAASTSSTAATVSSTASVSSVPSPYQYSCSRTYDPFHPSTPISDPFMYIPPAAGPPPSYNPSRQTISAVNPFAMNESSTSQMRPTSLQITSAPSTSQVAQSSQQPAALNQVVSSSHSLPFAHQHVGSQDAYANIDWRVYLRPKAISQLQGAAMGCGYITSEQILEAERKLFAKARTEEDYKVATRRLVRLLKDKIASSSRFCITTDGPNIEQLVESV